jgi:thiamine-monophosphate kinase
VGRTNRAKAVRDRGPGEAETTPASRGRGELEALERIAARLSPAPAGEVWIGDDAAVLRNAGNRMLFTVDVVVEDIHADLALIGLDDLGWRSVTTAVSDIAAMGGRADSLVVSVAAPPTTDLDLLYTGITEAASRHEVNVVGGDLSTASKISVTVAVVGHVPDDRPPVLRSGAVAGDALLVTGPLGAAAAGLRILRAGQSDAAPTRVADGPPGLDRVSIQRLTDAHRRPVARLAEGEVARNCGATSMIDISDGLASDVRRVATASGVGVSLDGAPGAKGATETEALCGGDDYELLFSIGDATHAVRAFENAGLRTPLVIGTCTSDPSSLLFRHGLLPDCGWEHPWLSSSRSV